MSACPYFWFKPLCICSLSIPWKKICHFKESACDHWHEENGHLLHLRGKMCFHYQHSFHNLIICGYIQGSRTTGMPLNPAAMHSDPLIYQGAHTCRLKLIELFVSSKWCQTSWIIQVTAMKAEKKIWSPVHSCWNNSQFKKPGSSQELNVETLHHLSARGQPNILLIQIF